MSPVFAFVIWPVTPSGPGIRALRGKNGRQPANRHKTLSCHARFSASDIKIPAPGTNPYHLTR
ncbi:hypothetical protein CSC3H3_02275 [Thalassospira marina]|uniref:Uncharacterized protein n=1 Tax=Thalassospira marina TaxID=2048283 RepID=A0ABN5FEP9_9PROT|nr:hypothetical protein CSC3H3_02275 [Thalassospira marina]